MADLLTTDQVTGKHFRYPNFSATIIDSYVTGISNVSGMTWDGINVLSSRQTAPSKQFKHSGFSATIDDSYLHVNVIPEDMTWDGSNVLSSGSAGANDKHYKHSSFSATIIDSYDLESPSGMTTAGPNVMSARPAATKKHLKHSGFSSTITDSYVYPDENPEGMTWSFIEKCVMSFARIDLKAYQHNSFSATIEDSFPLAYTYPQGMTWDGRYSGGPPANAWAQPQSMPWKSIIKVAGY